MNFDLNDYKKALSVLQLDYARILLRDLHFKISLESEDTQESIYKYIDQGFTLSHCRSKSTYKKFILDSLWTNQPKRKNDLDNAIQFIVYLFLEYNYYAEYRSDTSGHPLILWDRKPNLLLHKPDTGTIYDCFYWRTEQDQIGVASLQVYNNWKKADMIFHYKTKPNTKTYLHGDIRQEKSNLYITLQDDETKQFPYRPVTTLLTLYASPDEEKREYLLGCFSSVNRDSSIPICGLMVLHVSSSTSIDDSPFLEAIPNSDQRNLVNIPTEISFMLTQKRLKVPEKVIQKKIELPLFDQYDKIAPLAGRYQAYLFTFHSNTHAFKNRYTEIMPDGIIRTYLSENPNEYDEGFIRRYGNVVTIHFNYNKDNDTYKHQYYLQTDDKFYLRGIFAGVSDNGLITSGKVILEKLNSNQPRKNQLIRISKQRFHPDLEHILKHPVLSEFFGTSRDFVGTENSYPFDHFTDLPILDYINQWNKIKLTQQTSLSVRRGVTHPNLQGAFECFFITKDTEDTYPLANKNILLEQLPIYIEETKVTMVHGGREFTGNLLYDGLTRFRIIFYDSFYTLTFTIPIPKSKRANQLSHMFGIVSSINLKNPEASAAVLFKAKKSFDKLEYNRYHSITELLPLEVERRGLVSYLMGDWNRFVRVPSTSNRDFKPKNSTYRRTFWAAACYWGIQYQATQKSNDKKECLSNLIRAFRHAFAMNIFSDTELGSSTNFPQELIEDRDMLINELDKSLNFKEAHDLVNKLWNVN